MIKVQAIMKSEYFLEITVEEITVECSLELGRITQTSSSSLSHPHVLSQILTLIAPSTTLIKHILFIISKATL